MYDNHNKNEKNTIESRVGLIPTLEFVILYVLLGHMSFPVDESD